ncbi:enoyl-CoA hydratase [Pacificimonas flava]|uniref:Enoyl-CoA hydratase n=1 Tax=Pacificimonas flava TaxID=1234595 RepID=A0A219B8T1_9SPHN|nr:enoyl-CoA hydratase [Pacificimonas flava]
MVDVERNPAGYAVVTLNRPGAMNALSQELRSDLARAVRELEDDEDIRVLILTGAGERAFTAGLDLKELAGGASVGAAVDEEDPVQSLNQFSGPIIGAINGVAITGGFEVALACDVLIASENARFADTHARVGIMPGWGLSQKLSRIVGVNRAKELSLTGNFIGAAQAAEWGLVNRVVPAGDLLPTCRQLAEDMLSTDPQMLKDYLALIDDGYATTFAEGMELESRASERNRSVTADDVGARIAGVQARGRAQKS